MKTYKVTTAHATFGLGMVLKLSEEQSSIRDHALIKKGKNTFEVKEPVQFKQGEVVGVVKGKLSRFLEDRLEEVGKKKTAQSTKQQTTDAEKDSEFPKLEHVQFGKYNVYDRDGKQVNKELLKKEEAELLFEEIQDEDVTSGV